MSPTAETSSGTSCWDSAVGKGQEHHVQPVQLGHLGGRVRKDRVGGGQRRGVSGHRLRPGAPPAVATATSRSGCPAQQTEQFHAGVARGPDHTDLHGLTLTFCSVELVGPSPPGTNPATASGDRTASICIYMHCYATWLRARGGRPKSGD